MDSITITITRDKIEAAFTKAAEDVFGSSYGSPIRKVVEKELESREGELQTIVREIITTTMQAEDFRKKLGDILMQKMVESSLKK